MKIIATDSVPLVYRIGSYFCPVLLLHAYDSSLISLKDELSIQMR